MVFAITEPDAGSNTHKLDTVATRDGDGWRLQGRKYYISGVDEADAVLVVSRTGVEEGSGRGRLSLFIVDTDAPGLDRTPIELHVNAPERQFILFLDDVRVAGDRLLGDEGDGLRQVFTRPQPRADHRRRRRQRHRPLRPGQGGRLRQPAPGLGRAHRRPPGPGPPAGRGQDRGRAGPPDDPEGRLGHRRRRPRRRRGGQHGQVRRRRGGHAAVDVAIQVHGGNGFAAEYGLAGLWWMARVLRTAPVSREMILNYVAEHSLRLPRSY